MLVDGRWRSSTLPNTSHPRPHLLGRQLISLPADQERTGEDLKTLLERKPPAHAGGDVSLPLPLHLQRVGTGQTGDEGQQLLPLLIGSLIVQLHCQCADRTGETLRHVVNGTHGLIDKTCSHNSRLVDARAAILSRKGMRASFQLPVQDVVEAVHRDHPYPLQSIMVLPRDHPCQPGEHPMSEPSGGWLDAGMTRNTLGAAFHNERPIPRMPSLLHRRC